MQDLTVTLFQSDLAWEDVDTNIAAFDEKISRLAGRRDLIILPEMFPTGFSMNADSLAETMEGPAVKWLIDIAHRYQVNITGSMIITENDRYFNRLIWARPDGELLTYDKRHLFRYAGEHKTYTAGSRQMTISLNGWKIRPFICYDLRFPAWTRNSNNGYDLAIFIANWPQTRADHWKTLLTARAIENQSVVIGVNRVGTDGNGLKYSGDSSVIDPTGRVLFQSAFQELEHTIRLSYADLRSYRKSFPALMDADRFQVEI